MDKTEIEGLVPAFRAALMAEIGRHRGGGHDRLGGVSAFIAAVEGVHARYVQKLETFATSADRTAAEGKINEMADSEIDRSKLNGRVEFAS